ncbi:MULTISPECIES: TSUP family transporter [Pseudomonas]|uniref:Probable membrane transporter protein n=2 Tax=Pseudomonas TaxID=286 RepID=A0ABS0MY68_PSELU|nr:MULTISPECIES: TSUP family transporter [Pseudomonas]MBH3441670.1 TSUP family transporter [Pseudomonas luteola]SEQ60898.1 hypothetical protein SAMN05216409_10715 [Pseudomonas lutea]
MDVVLDPTFLLLLGLVAFAAGFIDTLAGGGGLITVPTLMLAQIPPVQAIATNKLQSTFGALIATLTLLRKRKIAWADVKKPFLTSFIGAAVGAVVIQRVDASALEVLVPFILGGIALYFLLAPGAGTVERKPRMGERLHRLLVVPLIGFYDGFFGPGTGSFFSLSEVALRGRDLITATATAKSLNLASNLASLAIFIMGGKVLWLVGGIMAVGQLAGAYLGSLAVIGGGARLIRPLIVAICFVMIGRYLYQNGYLSSIAHV